jgi:hypothetical protein
LEPFNSEQKVIEENLRENLIRANVFYPRLEYTLIKQIEKMLPFDIVSSVGGTLGLFICISFFTFVEIIQVIFELFGVVN